MSDLHNTPTQPVARKEHRCIYCGGPILTGERYVQQTGFYDGVPYRNKYHAECWEVCIEDSKYGDEEFTPYSAPYPDRVQAIVDARHDALHNAGLIE